MLGSWSRGDLQKKAVEPGVFPYKNLRKLDALGSKGGDPLRISAPRRWLRGSRGPTGV
jgi:hypothetical protein